MQLKGISIDYIEGMSIEIRRNNNPLYHTDSNAQYSTQYIYKFYRRLHSGNSYPKSLYLDHPRFCNMLHRTTSCYFV